MPKKPTKAEKLSKDLAAIKTLNEALVFIETCNAENKRLRASRSASLILLKSWQDKAAAWTKNYHKAREELAATELKLSEAVTANETLHAENKAQQDAGSVLRQRGKQYGEERLKRYKDERAASALLLKSWQEKSAAWEINYRRANRDLTVSGVKLRDVTANHTLAEANNTYHKNQLHLAQRETDTLRTALRIVSSKGKRP